MSMSTCFLLDCQSSNPNPPAHLFHFPYNATSTLRERWLRNIPQDISRPFDPNHHRICDRHFRDEYIIKDTSAKSTRNAEQARWFLVPGAIPTTFGSEMKRTTGGRNRKRRAPSTSESEEEHSSRSMKYHPDVGDDFEDRCQETKLCLLCRDQIVFERKVGVGAHFAKWKVSCTASLRDVLELDESFQKFLSKADYCDSCLLLVRDIDYTLKNLNSLQARLSHSRQKVEALLRNNVRIAKRNEMDLHESELKVVKTKKDSEDVKMIAYDLSIKSIWEAVANIRGRSCAMKTYGQKKPKESCVPVIVNVTSKPEETTKEMPGQASSEIVKKKATIPTKPPRTVFSISKHLKPRVTFQALTRFVKPSRPSAMEINKNRSKNPAPVLTPTSSTVNASAIPVPAMPASGLPISTKPDTTLPGSTVSVSTRPVQPVRASAVPNSVVPVPAVPVPAIPKPRLKKKRLQMNCEKPGIKLEEGSSVEIGVELQTNLNPHQDSSANCSMKTEIDKSRTSCSSSRPWRLPDEAVETFGIYDEFPPDFGFGIL